MKKSVAKPAALALLAAALLCACEAPDSEEESAVSRNGKYDSAEDLGAAAKELGLKFLGFTETEAGLRSKPLGLAQSSGVCNVGADEDGGDQFFVYGPGRAAWSGEPYTVEDQLNDWGTDFPGAVLITGKNWIISLEKDGDYQKLAGQLNGTVLRK